MTEVLDWVQEEMAGLSLGDARLVTRQQRLLSALFMQASQSIPTACQGAAEIKAAYRWLDHVRVTPGRVLAPHTRATQHRVAQHPVVLTVQDTSELDFTGKQVAAELGPLTSTHCRGLFVHPTLAVTPEKVCLGVVAVELRVRPAGTVPEQHTRPLAAKESQRWLTGYQTACALAAATPGTQIISVADREGDIFELYAEAGRTEAGRRADFVIRAAQNRRVTVADADGVTLTKLWDAAAAAPVLGTVSYHLTRTAVRQARDLTQTVQAVTVTVQPPARPAGTVPLAPVSLQAVLVREMAPPAGEDPVEWLLLTSLAVATLPAALWVVQIYLCRWQVEVYFKVLKSGCRVEKLYLATRDRLTKVLALYLIIAWRVLYLAQVGRACPALSCTALFSASEWQAVYLVATKQPPPAAPPSLDTLVRMIAGFGSFVGRTGDGPPGITSLWIGLQRAMDYARAYDTFGPGSRFADPDRPSGSKGVKVAKDTYG